MGKKEEEKRKRKIEDEEGRDGRGGKERLEGGGREGEEQAGMGESRKDGQRLGLGLVPY